MNRSFIDNQTHTTFLDDPVSKEIITFDCDVTAIAPQITPPITQATLAGNNKTYI